LERKYDLLLEYWQQAELKFNAGAGPAAIQVLEDHLKFSFPADFREYLLEINGMEDYEWDADMISFWSIERMKKEYDEDSSMPIRFADYLISSHAYGFIPNDENVYTDYSPEPVASSFVEFIHLYLTDRDKLFK
jgi:hypothetical protein